MRNNIIAGMIFIILVGIIVYFSTYRINQRLMAVQEAIVADTVDASPRDVQEILDQSKEAVDLAYSLLGLFEALSLAVTIGGVVLVAIGFGRFNEARDELTKTRESVGKELEGYRQKFEEEIQKREDELLKLRGELENSAKVREEELVKLRGELENSAIEDRQITANALLANALIPLGERQYKASDYRGALNTYNRALELDPNNPVVNQRLGYVHTQMGDLNAAKQHYEKAIATEPDFAPALAGLGFVTRRFAERLDKTVEDPLLSDEERVQKRLERNQLLTKAEEYLQKALLLSPRLVDDDGESWWGVLGGLYKRRGQIKEAIEAYRQVTVVTPQSSYGFGNLAQLYMKQGDNKRMLETFERVEQIASKEADASEGNFWGYADLIVSSYAVGKHEQALRAIPIALAIAPIDSPYMLEGLIETLRDVVEHVSDYKRQPILEAIQFLAEEMERRSAQVRRAEELKAEAGVAETGS
jgi:tetratricopeptide (TPR) repeat protein